MTRMLDVGALTLSAFDARWPGYMPVLVRHLEACGYSTLWTSEHHTTRQSASPLMIVAAAAAMTSRIRLGTAGIMMRYYNPLRVAKDAHLLELLFPDRIDLGIVGGRLPRDIANTLIVSADDTAYHEAVDRLLGYIRAPSTGVPSLDQFLCRNEASAPRTWTCSTSIVSAQNAGARGMGFIYYLGILEGCDERLGAQAIAAYRDAFVPHAGMPFPRAGVVVSVCCGESDDEADATWRRSVAKRASLGKIAPALASAPRVPDRPPSAMIVGSAEHAVERLRRLAMTIHADELIVQAAGDSIERVLDGYSLLAEAFTTSSRTAPRHLDAVAVA